MGSRAVVAGFYGHRQLGRSPGPTSVRGGGGAHSDGSGEGRARESGSQPDKSDPGRRKRSRMTSSIKPTGRRLAVLTDQPATPGGGRERVVIINTK